MHVPERSFYNWQKVGAGLVAHSLKEQIQLKSELKIL